MKKYLYILAVLCLNACKPAPDQIVRKFILNNAADPSSIRVLYHSEVLRPERTKQDTFYHVAAFGDDVAYTDSIRIETHHFPEHYYCYWTIEGNDTLGHPCHCNIELAAFPNGEVIFYSKYGDRYYGAISSYTYAQCDTIMDIRTPGFYKDAGVWALKQMLLNYK